jgi:quercetin dioxygenase-like cupin family protein
MKISTLESIEKIKVTMPGAEKVIKQVPVGTKDGAPNFSFRVFTMEPGGHTPYHQHPFEHVNYIIEGEGVLVDKDGVQHPLKKGDFALVSPDEKHQYRNSSSQKSMSMICAVPKEYE